MEYQQFSHISFDLWLTLIQSHPEFKHKRNRLLIDFFSIDVYPDIVDSTYNKYDNLFNRTNEITGGNLDCYELWLVLLGDLKVDISKVSLQLLQQFIDEAEKLFFEYHPTLLDSDTPKLFERLVNEGHTLSLLCNTAFTKSDFLKKLLIHLGVAKYLSFQLYSDEMGYSKPNIKVFEELFSEISKRKTITKNEILHIGDNPVADLGGAKNFGIHGRLLLPEETVVTIVKG